MDQNQRDRNPSEPDRPGLRDEERGFFGDLFQRRYREVTFSALIFAILIGVVMNAAITYAGLKIGFTIGGSAIAAVLGFGVLRGLLRRGSILETNIAQTVASAVNTSNSGVIFTVPVLFLIGYELTIGGRTFWLITLACLAGAMLGTAFIIPLRKQMIDIERLRFPSPTGVATILKSPGAGAAKAVVLLIGCILGALIYLPAGLPALTREASLDDLDRLVAQERISQADADRTRAIDGWITAQAVPDEIVARGALVLSLREARQAYDTAKDSGCDGLAEPRARVRELEAAVDAARQSSALYGDDLVAVATQVARGQQPWESLRDRTIGWAQKPMMGYADLQWRLPHEVDEEATASARAANPAAPELLTIRVDRDRNGKPDLLLTDDRVDVGRWLGIPDEYQLIFAIAPFALGAGYITGKAGLYVLAGGILAFFVLNPLAFNMGWMPTVIEAHQAPGYGFSAFNRPLGIGLLLGGALMGVLFSLPAIKEAVKSIAVASKLKGGGDELGIKTLTVAVLAAFVVLFFADDLASKLPINQLCPVTHEEICEQVEAAEYAGYSIGFETEQARTAWDTEWTTTQKDAFLATLNAKPGWFSGLNSHVRAALIALIGAIWIWFAGIIIAQCAGMTDWSPISGLALLTVVLVLLLAGTGAVVGAVLLGAALCVAITLAADMMGDMKTGYLVGSKPKRQQVTELAVVWIGPIVCMLTLMIIVNVNMTTKGIPIGPGTDTVAPQAQALEAVITGVQGGEMPYMLYGFGALLGSLLGLGAFAGLGVLIGLSIYLPFFYIATYGIGCVINIILQKIWGRGPAESWGVPFAAGLIVGESILALVINIVVLARG
ncbi:MAG TPA: OPT/YSL family transporter [Phycisphaerales bacterium]|nr:OPT/YSL family transporter [Phycisphaerales bacterium]